MLVIILAISFGMYVLNKLLGGFSAVRALFSQLFGTTKRTAYSQYGKAAGNGPSAGKEADADPFSGECNNDVSHTNEKIFSPGEGEYVDFEEIK